MAQDTNDDALDDLITAGAADDEFDIDGDRGDSLEPVAEETAEEPVTEEPVAEETAEEPVAGEATEEITDESAEEPSRDRSKWVPRERFDEVNERRKAAEERIREQMRMAQATEEPEAFDFDQRERDYMEAVLDGETDKALAIRKEIRAAEQALAERLARQAGDDARNKAIQDIRLQETIEELTAQYDVFNPDSEAYDQDLTDEALMLRDTFTQQGLSPASALRKAVNYVAKIHDLAPSGGMAVEETRGLGDTSNAMPKPTPEQVERKVRAAESQPASVPSRSRERTALDLENMTDDEFDSLSKDVLRKLRGDYAA